MDKNSLTYIALRDALTRLDLSVVQDLISDVIMRGSKEAALVICYKEYAPTILYFNYSSPRDLAEKLISDRCFLDQYPLFMHIFDLQDDFFSNLSEQSEMIAVLLNKRYGENKLLILEDFNDKVWGSFHTNIFYGPQIEVVDFWAKVSGD